MKKQILEIIALILDVVVSCLDIIERLADWPW